MAELTVADVVQFTKGRLTDDGPEGETQRMLNAALAVARREAGWHVSPVKMGDVVAMDGPGGAYLYPPTRKIVNLTSVTDGGVDVLADVAIPAQMPWKLVRKTGPWSCELSGIAIVMDHGYTEIEAADWRHAILAMVDEISRSTGSSGAGELVRKRVDDVEYQWSEGQLGAAADQALYSVKSIIDGYRLLRSFA